MPYNEHFLLADDFIKHLDVVIGGTQDAFIKSRYIGFLAVTAVTVFELAIKEILIDFSHKENKVLGNFATNFFDRINGRIAVSEIKGRYVRMFGEEYVGKFQRNLDECEERILKSDASSVKSCYGNIITWRNEFAHEGRIPNTATYEEVKNSYLFGKNVIHCIAEAMSDK